MMTKLFDMIVTLILWMMTGWGSWCYAFRDSTDSVHNIFPVYTGCIGLMMLASLGQGMEKLVDWYKKIPRWRLYIENIVALGAAAVLASQRSYLLSICWTFLWLYQYVLTTRSKVVKL